MNKRKVFIAFAVVEVAIALLMMIRPLWYAQAVTAAYNSTVRIVDSAGTVLDGIASATTANYNQTVRVVDSNGNVLNGFLGSSQLNSSNVMQTLNTQAGNPLATFLGFSYGVANTEWSWTMPAGTLGPFDVMKCHLYGDLQNNTGGTVGDTMAFAIGNKNISYGFGPTSNTGVRMWTVDVTFANDGATTLNSLDGFLVAGGAPSVGGISTTALNQLYGANSATGLDTTTSQTLALNVTIGAATPAATPTNSPTAATTPIWHLYDAHCWKLPGTTPTPTPTLTPTPTAT